MMKKKGKTYILLTVVLGIWGTIGYQIYSKLNTDDSPVIIADSSVSFTPKKTIAKDTFSIDTTHRDPFLGKPYHSKKSARVKRVASVKKDSVIFPQLRYKGVISKQRSAQNIYIIDVAGTQQLFRVGKTITDVKLIKGNKKSVTISFKGKRKTISVSK
ncbi:hypothetical protein [Kordia sp.]|uniref:hypothetical protein n=1 Tax=Kordia sp. TaxID=1965332 RepID=UPI003B5AE098